MGGYNWLLAIKLKQNKIKKDDIYVYYLAKYSVSALYQRAVYITMQF